VLKHWRKLWQCWAKHRKSSSGLMPSWSINGLFRERDVVLELLGCHCTHIHLFNSESGLCPVSERLTKELIKKKSATLGLTGRPQGENFCLDNRLLTGHGPGLAIQPVALMIVWRCLHQTQCIVMATMSHITKEPVGHHPSYRWTYLHVTCHGVITRFSKTFYS